MKKHLLIILLLLSQVGTTQERESVLKGYYYSVVDTVILGNRTSERKALDDGFNYSRKRGIKKYKTFFPFYIETTIKYDEQEKDTIVVRDTIFVDRIVYDTIRDVEIIAINPYLGNPIIVDTTSFSLNINLEEKIDGETFWESSLDYQNGGNSGGGNTGENETDLDVLIRHESIPEFIDGELFNKLFKTHYWSRNTNELSFNIPLSNGEYYVRFYISSAYITTRTIGSRVWDILLENIIVYENFDPNLIFGSLNAGMIELETIVEDNELNISFVNKSDHASINAIQIIKK